MSVQNVGGSGAINLQRQDPNTPVGDTTPLSRMEPSAVLEGGTSTRQPGYQ